MLAIIHAAPARIEHGKLLVDRKLHVGMQMFCAQLECPVVSLHPELGPGAPIMDAVEVPLDQLGYEVMTVKAGPLLRALPSERARVRETIARSRLVYGAGLWGIECARELGVPYVLMAECDLQTEIVVSASQVSRRSRKLVRAVRTSLRYVARIPDLARAREIHCNGYPVYEQFRFFNPNRVLYLDSRMSADLVIGEEQLQQRLASRSGRPLRLLFSGRYEPLKGAVDAVAVGIECVRRGLDVEMHCYGHGSQRAEMDRLVAKHGAADKIKIHDVIPFPELVEISRTFDLFVCCHIQSDPSCTYLESLGAGLPIVGYGNRMWRTMSAASGAGAWSKLGDPVAVADRIEALAGAPGALATASESARRFALSHTFEHEFSRRSSALNAILRELSGSVSSRLEHGTSAEERELAAARSLTRDPASAVSSRAARALALSSSVSEESARARRNAADR